MITISCWRRKKDDFWQLLNIRIFSHWYRFAIIEASEIWWCDISPISDLLICAKFVLRHVISREKLSLMTGVIGHFSWITIFKLLNCWQYLSAWIVWLMGSSSKEIISLRSHWTQSVTFPECKLPFTMDPSRPSATFQLCLHRTLLYGIHFSSPVTNQFKEDSSFGLYRQTQFNLSFSINKCDTRASSFKVHPIIPKCPNDSIFSHKL